MLSSHLFTKLRPFLSSLSLSFLPCTCCVCMHCSLSPHSPENLNIGPVPSYRHPRFRRERERERRFRLESKGWLLLLSSLSSLSLCPSSPSLSPFSIDRRKTFFFSFSRPSSPAFRSKILLKCHSFYAAAAARSVMLLAGKSGEMGA